MPDPDVTPTGEPAAAAGAGTPPADPKLSADETPRFTNADLERITKERLATWERSQEAKAKKAADEAEAKRLADQQEFKALAEQHQARVHELEPVAQQAERYEAALKKHLATARKDLPAHITELLDQLDVAAQLDWISAHQAELGQAPAGAAGVPATPRAAGTASQAEGIAQTRKELQATGRFSL